MIQPRKPQATRGLLGLLLLFALSYGCDSGGAARNTEEVTLDSLPDSAGTTPGEAWQSSGWEEGWLAYPGDTLLRVAHGLGRTPSSVEAYVSFASDGFAAGIASGDLARIVSVDATHIALENGTKQDLFLRIVLR